MSTRSRRRGLPALLALLATACIELPSIPSTPPTTPSGAPEMWEGTARYSESTPDRVYTEYPPTVATFETTVTWKRNPNPVQPLPAGAVGYIVASGHLRLTLTGGPCLVHGDVERDWAYELPSDYNTLVVKEDGSYYGSVYQFVAFGGTQSNCSGRKDRQFERTMALIFNGNLASGRVQGTLVETIGGDTVTGSWDFGAR